MKLHISKELPKDLKDKPVVAMESTVFSHLGLPMPARKEALQNCKQAVVQEGAIPAVTAMFAGEIFVGLSDEQEEMILNAEEAAEENLEPVAKLAIRDFPVAAAKKQPIGVTTVSATVAIAAKAGIKVMATGGIGGVHRASSGTSLDVSSDLTALGRYPVGVVCSGAKGFLDLPNTLETLETLGVPVLGFGTSQLPAFWCESSGLELVHRVDNFISAARVVAELEESGAVFAVPVPSEKSLSPDLIDGAINSAIAEAEKKGVVGAKQTPFILRHIAEATKGESLIANLALLEKNAQVAGGIAVSLKS